MKAIVDQETCTGCELCTQECPQVFKMDNDKAVAAVDTVPEDALGTCQQAADDCPVDAIAIQE